MVNASSNSLFLRDYLDSKLGKKKAHVCQTTEVDCLQILLFLCDYLRGNNKRI